MRWKNALPKTPASAQDVLMEFTRCRELEILRRNNVTGQAS